MIAITLRLGCTTGVCDRDVGVFGMLNEVGVSAGYLSLKASLGLLDCETSVVGVGNVEIALGEVGDIGFKTDCCPGERKGGTVGRSEGESKRDIKSTSAGCFLDEDAEIDDGAGAGVGGGANFGGGGINGGSFCTGAVASMAVNESS